MNDREKAVRAHLNIYPSDGAPRIAAATSIPQASVGRILKRIHRELPPSKRPINAGTERKENDKGFELDSGPTTTIKTLDDLLISAKVDRALWKVERFLVNKYSVATKNEETGSVTVTDLFQVKATLVPQKGAELQLAMKGLIDDLRNEAKLGGHLVAPFVKKPKADDKVLLEISPFDLHLGKLSWAQETGVPYDTKLSEEAFTLAIHNLWALASGFPVSNVLLVLGNDFFTADNSADTTTAGTPQHVDSRFARNFRRGWQLMRKAVEFLRARCSGGVDVLIVPGNHDTDTAFCAGEVLSALYEHTKDVRVDNGPNLRKYFRFGTCLLGFTHGDKEKHAQLPLLMANEKAADWAETTVREIHLGHLHHSRSTTFVSGNEFNSIRVRVLPSLSGADAWHHSHGYTARRAAEAYLWSFKSGYVGHLSWSPPTPAALKAA